MVQYGASIILQAWYTLLAISKKITERVTVNGPLPKNKENHGPLLKELLKLLFLFLSVKAYEGLYSYGEGP